MQFRCSNIKNVHASHKSQLSCVVHIFSHNWRMYLFSLRNSLIFNDWPFCYATQQSAAGIKKTSTPHKLVMQEQQVGLQQLAEQWSSYLTRSRFHWHHQPLQLPSCALLSASLLRRCCEQLCGSELYQLPRQKPEAAEGRRSGCSAVFVSCARTGPIWPTALLMRQLPTELRITTAYK